MDRWIRLLSISALILVPCFWHPHIEAGDLGSHIYNAWLAQLIEHGQAPGLRIAYPSTNILFDSLLSGLAKVFGLHAAEILSVAIAVLIFFWETFALVAAASKRAAKLRCGRRCKTSEKASGQPAAIVDHNPLDAAASHSGLIWNHSSLIAHEASKRDMRLSPPSLRHFDL